MRVIGKELNPGRLNKYVDILRQDGEDNRVGGRRSETLRLVRVAQVWASITNVSGSERFESNQLQAELTHRITIRYRKDITRQNKIRYGERMFNIRYIVDWQEKKRFLILHVAEEV